ncbi:PREDICTED: uncharacterized protein LOC107345552 isoform X2 [Acropora digitifera]|uniref:uncharacterized protein LOC107345552 isoform X2 n=1 Tax=Acropora digitifera TaxID=70779 RepID=UPI00077AC318|nr:PREDICTED: uncharacterized protein LOC107345552 isoform X2 [Acropora digitifera]
MAKLKTKLVILAVVGVVLAVFYPKIKSAYGKHVKPHADVAGKTFKTIKDFSIFGYHVPWKYVLPGFALFLAVQLFRRRRRLKKLAEDQKKKDQTFMTEEEAKKHLTELQKRLDTTERTMHLVMKQMEAVTKCLAKTLADDPAMSGDKSLAEITEGLVNLKESNV